MIVAAFRSLLLLLGLLPLVGQAQDASARKADSLFTVWCDTTVERYPRTIALARFFGIDSAFTEDQASRLKRSGTLPGLTERQRQYQLAYAWHARGTELGRIVAPWPTENYEGVAATRERGATILWLVSDNDQMWHRPSYLLKLRLD